MADPYEKNDVAKSSPEIAKKLNKKLHNWLTEVDAKYPTVDNEFDITKRKNYVDKVKNELLPKLEKERIKML